MGKKWSKREGKFKQQDGESFLSFAQGDSVVQNRKYLEFSFLNSSRKQLEDNLRKAFGRSEELKKGTNLAQEQPIYIEQLVRDDAWSQKQKKYISVLRNDGKQKSVGQNNSILRITNHDLGLNEKRGKQKYVQLAQLQYIQLQQQIMRGQARCMGVNSVIIPFPRLF